MIKKLIALEGRDGIGKETQSKMLYERLKKEGYNVVLVSFPNYDIPSGVEIKEMLQKGLANDKEEKELQQMIYSNRVSTLKPLMESEEEVIVISDRCYLSKILYNDADFLKSMLILNYHRTVHDIDDTIYDVNKEIDCVNIIYQCPVKYTEQILKDREDTDYYETKSKQEQVETKILLLKSLDIVQRNTCMFISQEEISGNVKRGLTFSRKSVEDIHEKTYEFAKLAIKSPDKHMTKIRRSVKQFSLDTKLIPINITSNVNTYEFKVAIHWGRAFEYVTIKVARDSDDIINDVRKELAGIILNKYIKLNPLKSGKDNMNYRFYAVEHKEELLTRMIKLINNEFILAITKDFDTYIESEECKKYKDMFNLFVNLNEEQDNDKIYDYKISILDDAEIIEGLEFNDIQVTYGNKSFVLPLNIELDKGLTVFANNLVINLLQFHLDHIVNTYAGDKLDSKYYMNMLYARVGILEKNSNLYESYLKVVTESLKRKGYDVM